MPTLGAGERAARISALQAQINALSGQRRSRSEFRPWRADIFYHLFAAAASLLVYWFAEVSSLRAIVIGGCASGCFAPLRPRRTGFVSG